LRDKTTDPGTFRYVPHPTQLRDWELMIGRH
jgi:hypothetical protein